MNALNAHHYDPLIAALKAGKTIQIKASEGEEWCDMKDVHFGADARFYRIKPSPPLRAYAVVYPNSDRNNLYWLESDALRNVRIGGVVVPLEQKI
jgi:hypothetical protein